MCGCIIRACPLSDRDTPARAAGVSLPSYSSYRARPVLVDRFVHLSNVSQTLQCLRQALMAPAPTGSEGKTVAFDRPPSSHTKYLNRRDSDLADGLGE